jgi:hypothetical protein
MWIKIWQLKMKTMLLILFALIMIPIATESFAEELEIEFGETVSHENLKLYFYDIEDSRCPSDVKCIWEGKVAVMIHISNQTHKIGGSLEIGYPVTYISPYTVTLVDVKPYPVSTEKADYTATLDITKPEPRPSDFRETNEGNSLTLTIIQSMGAILIVSFIIIYAIKKRKK